MEALVKRLGLECPPMPAVRWPWWSHLDAQAKQDLRDAYQAVYWQGVANVAPYIPSAAIAAALVGLILGVILGYLLARRRA
jgi:hypothetical protein